MPSDDTRVWVTHPSTSKPIENFKPRSKDIIIVYQPEFQGLTMVYGHQSDERSRLLRVFNTAIRYVRLREVFGDNHRILGVQSPGYTYQLSQSDWTMLRQVIIDADRDGDVEEVIEQLEALQNGLPIIVGDDAIVFDAIRTAIQIFGSSKTGDFLNSLDKIRDTLSNSADNEQLRFTDTLTENLWKTDFIEPVNSLSDFERDLIGGYRAGYNNTESYTIRQDFENVGPDFERRTDGIPDDMRQNMARLFDPDTGRRLTLFFAHRAASGERDLAASDLIYVTESHMSIVFVQYKRLSERGTVDLRPRDRGQLDEILGVCKRQNDGCTNFSYHDEEYKTDTHMRLGDCPVLYKLLKKEPEISPQSKAMNGDYMPACLLYRLLQEGNNRRKEILKRAFPHSHFYGMLRRAQIGPRANEFEVLQNVVREKMASVVAIETG